MSTNSNLATPRVYYRFEEIDGDGDDPDAGTLAMAGPIPTLESYEKDSVKAGFWRRQFGKEVTWAQCNFDWTFGFVLPLACFYFDPIVFRSPWGPRDTLLGQYQVAAYITGFMTTMTVVAWLLWRERFESASVVPAVVLTVGSVISLLIGIVIFPYSLIGVLVGIGLLGFTPLFTAFVYGRNAVRAFRSAESSEG